MNQNTDKLLFALLRSTICGNQLEKIEKELFSEDILQELFVISKKHDVAYLFATGLDKNGLLKGANDKIGKEIIMAIYRYTQLNYEYERVCDALESAYIPFIPLKDSVLRRWYPEPWMRTSCDIDILVHEQEVEQTAEYLATRCGYSLDGKGSHDISLFSPGKIHIHRHTVGAALL